MVKLKKRALWKVLPSVIGDVWMFEKKLQLVWSSPVKKVQERCESSVGKRCLAIGRKSGKGKQESNEQWRQVSEARKKSPLKICSLPPKKTWQGRCSDFLQKLEIPKQWARKRGRRGIGSRKPPPHIKGKPRRRALPQVRESSYREKMIPWILVTLIASVRCKL